MPRLSRGRKAIGRRHKKHYGRRTEEIRTEQPTQTHHGTEQECCQFPAYVSYPEFFNDGCNAPDASYSCPMSGEKLDPEGSSACKPSPLYSTDSPDWAPTINLVKDKIKPTTSRAGGNKRVMTRRRKKQKTDSEPTMMSFRNLMPLPLPQNPTMPVARVSVDLARVKTEPPEELFPAGLLTSTRNVMTTPETSTFIPENQASQSNTNNGPDEPSERPVPVGLFTSTRNIMTKPDTPFCQQRIASGFIPEKQATESNTNNETDRKPLFIITPHCTLQQQEMNSAQTCIQTVSHHPFSSQENSPQEKVYINAPTFADQQVNFKTPHSQTLNPPLESFVGETKPRSTATSKVQLTHPVTVSILGGTSCQTELTGADISKVEAVSESTTRNYTLVSKQLSCLQKIILNAELSSQALANTPEKVMLYTGFNNFELLMAVYNYVEAFVDSDNEISCAKFQEYLMTLIILKLNIPFDNLAHRFQYASEWVVKSIFEKWIHIMDAKLKHIVSWPIREKLHQTMSEQLQQVYVDKIAVSIGFLQVFSLAAPISVTEGVLLSVLEQQTIKAFKFLLGMTLNGVITFVSRGWSENISDQYLTEHCGILQNLLPGDFVLDESGISINGNTSHCAEVGTCNFSAEPCLLAVDRKEIPPVEHLNDPLEIVQNYQILQGPIQSSLIKGTLVDQIVSVCCALSNLTNGEVVNGFGM